MVFGEVSITRELDHEDRFQILSENLDQESKRTAGFQKILDQLDEDGDFRAAIERLEAFIQKREKAIDKVHGVNMERCFISDENIGNEFSNIRLAVNTPDAFLGN